MTDPTSPVGNASALTACRRADSKAKREEVRRVIAQQQANGIRVTYAGVARAAGVSLWLVKADGVRQLADTAIQQQLQDPARARAASRVVPEGQPVSLRGLRVDLELSRAELREVRRERDELKDRMRLHLGVMLEGSQRAELVDRIEELSQLVRVKNGDLSQQQGRIVELEAAVVALEDDLIAARAANRELMRLSNSAFSDFTGSSAQP